MATPFFDNARDAINSKDHRLSPKSDIF